MAAPPPILVLGGPTGTGKTSLAIELCRRLGGEIVGADSVQIYRGFDIGSAKPTPEQLADVAHHMLDMLDPDEPIDAASYAARADAAIASIAARGALPVVVGGTGLWLRALLRGLVELPPVDHELRARLDRMATEQGTRALHAWLARVDPEAATRIHPNDQRRTVRALEVFEQTGKPMGRLQGEHAHGSPRYRARTIFVDIERAHLEQALRERTRRMIAAGWAEETRRLCARYPRDLPALQSVGYRQMVEHVLDGVTVDVTQQRIERATRQYAKRQRTWFRGDPDFPPPTAPGEVSSDEYLHELQRWLGADGSR